MLRLILNVLGINKDDLKDINILNKQQDFSLGDLDNCIVDRVVRNEKQELVAYGIVKHMAEAIILVNYDVPVLSRARALRELMKVAVFGAKNAGCNQLHVFVKDPKLAESLKKHFNFKECQDTVLVKEL